jgi:hypothetical protein
MMLATLAFGDHKDRAPISSACRRTSRSKIFVMCNVSSVQRPRLIEHVSAEHNQTNYSTPLHTAKRCLLETISAYLFEDIRTIVHEKISPVFESACTIARLRPSRHSTLTRISASALRFGSKNDRRDSGDLHPLLQYRLGLREPRRSPVGWGVRMRLRRRGHAVSILQCFES